MMTEQGVVKRIIGGKARVLAKRGTMCDSCDHKSSCMTIGAGNDVEIEALNTANAEPGDHVTISIETASLLKITTLVYLFPVIALIIGIFTGQKLGKTYGFDPELSSLLSGFALFVLTFIIIKAVAGRMGKDKKYTPEITKIIYKWDQVPEEKEDEGEEESTC